MFSSEGCSTVETDAITKSYQKNGARYTDTERIAAVQEIYEKRDVQFQEVRGELSFLYFELVKRLQASNSSIPDIPFGARPVLSANMLIGANPLQETANYIEVLAKELCH